MLHLINFISKCNILEVTIILNYFIWSVNSIQYKSQVEINQSKSSLYVIISCDRDQPQNINNALEFFMKLNKQQIDATFLSVNEFGDVQPSIYSKTTDQAVEAISEYVCKCLPMNRITRHNSSEGFLELSAQLFSRLNDDDIVIIFSHHDQDVQNWPQSLQTIIRNKSLRLYYLKLKSAEDLIKSEQVVYNNLDKYVTSNIPKTIFVYQGNSNSKSNTKKNEIGRRQNVLDHKIGKSETLKLYGTTSTYLNIPPSTLQIATTIAGRIKSAEMVSPSGLVINIYQSKNTTDNVEDYNEDVEHFFTLGLPPNPKEQQWTIIISGVEYNLSVTASVSKNIDLHNFLILQQKYLISQVKRVDDASAVRYMQGNSRVEFLKSRGISGNMNDFLETIIDVDAISTFYSYPGKKARMIFIVRNNKSYPSGYRFYCMYTNQQCFVYPFSAFIQAGKSIQVMVDVEASGSEGSATIVTLTVEGTMISQREAYLFIGKPVSDTRKPNLDYEFVGDCMEANTGNSCFKKRWSVNVWAQDSESGLLNFYSEPPLLMYNSDFIVGTKEGVSATYSASCCNPKTDIVAIDVKGNVYRKTLDVEHQTLWFIEILAIILVSILLILIIIFSIFGIIRWRRRMRETSFLDH